MVDARAAKSGIQPRDVADTVKQLWKEADSPQSFAAALPKEGLTLALGSRDLVVLDQTGDVHPLTRCLNFRVADIREKLAEIDRSKVPTVEQAREAIRERDAEKETPAPIQEREHVNDNSQEAAVRAALERIIAGQRCRPKQDRETLAGGSREKSQTATGSRQRTTTGPTPKSKLWRPCCKSGQTREKTPKGRSWPRSVSTQAGNAGKVAGTGDRVDAGRITEKDRLREMARHLWEEGDKERRDGQKEKPPDREGKQDEQAARDRQREPGRDR